MGQKNNKTEKMGSGVAVWLKELRAPFFTAAIIPVIAGVVTAWAYFDKVFLPFQFVLTLVGAVFLHAGTNVINDYFDYKSGDDIVNKEKNQPFSGGSPYLPAGRISPSAVYKYALLFFALGGLIGIYLALDMGIQKGGWVIILLGVVGIGAGYFYVEPHVNLCGRGVGEAIVGLCFGPLVVFGAFYVQTRVFSIIPFLVGIPIGLLIAAVLYINQFPDYNADRSVGKRNIVVRLGKKDAIKGYFIIMFLAYFSILFAVVLGLASLPHLTPFALIALATAPVTIRSARILKGNYADSPKLAPAQALTIQVHLLTGLLLCISIFLSAIIVV